MTARCCRLHLIGDWRLTVDGEAIPLEGKKPRALFTYLALDDSQSHTRAELSRLLWPKSTEDKARGSLRQCLSRIRDALDRVSYPIISVTSDRVSIDSTAFDTDVEAALSIKNIQDPRVDISTKKKTLSSTLYSFFGISEELDACITRFEQNIHARALQQLRELCADTALPPARRMAAAEQALCLDEFDETAVRALMSLHMEAETPAAALRVYNQFYERLECEMDAEPSAATQALAVSIKLADTPAVALSPWPAPPPAAPKSADQASMITLAVLPFDVAGSIDDRAFISLGILEQLTCRLAAYRAPSVISSNTTRRYLGAAPRPLDVGAELNARYVLSGTVRLHGDAAALTAQLVETSSERVAWAITRTCSRDDLFQLDAPIAEQIARAVLPSVNAEELLASHTLPVRDLSAYQLMLQAKNLIFDLERDAFYKAGALLKRATEIDPTFSTAHALLADWYSIGLWEGWSGDPTGDQAALERHARTAIQLDPADGRIVALLAHNQMMLNREYDRALGMIEDAVDRSPNDAETLAWTVPTLANTRNSAAAIRNGLKSIALSPLDPFVFRSEHFLSIALLVDGDYERAAEYGLSSYRRAPNYRGNLRATIVALTAAGRTEEAAPLVEHHQEITPGFSVTEFQKIHGMRDPEDRQFFADRLRAAGLPT